MVYTTRLLGWLLAFGIGLTLPVSAAQPVERTKVIEPFEIPLLLGVPSSHGTHLAIERTQEAAYRGKWSLKAAATFDTNRRESYRIPLRREFKADPLRIAFQVRGTGNGATVVPVFSWIEHNRRREGSPAEAGPVDSADWQRFAFDLEALKRPEGARLRLEGLAVREASDASKYRENSSAAIFIDEVEVTKPTSPALPWELELHTGQLGGAFLSEPAEGLRLYAKIDFFTARAPESLKLFWEVRDSSDQLVASREERIGKIAGPYAIHEIRVKTGATTGPYVAAAVCYAGPKPEPVRERVYPVSDPRLHFKFVLPKEHTGTRFATGFVAAEKDHQVLRAQYEFTKGTGPRCDHFSLLVPEETCIPSSRLRAVSMRINVIDLDQGFHDTRVALIVRDAGGAVLELPEISLLALNGWKELKWDIPDWESGLVRFPMQIQEIRFWETGRQTWGNMQAGCQGMLDVDQVKLTYDELVPLRFSVANAKTSLSDFSGVESVGGDRFNCGPVDTAGHGDTHCLQVNLKEAAGRYNVSMKPAVPGCPIAVSLWAKTDIPDVGVRPALSHRGHWIVSRQLELASTKVPSDGNWHRLEWRIPFSGTGIYRNPAWNHILVYPLKLNHLEVSVPRKSAGKLLLDDLSYLTQLPLPELVSVSARSDLAEAGRLQLSAHATNTALKPVDVKLAYALADAAGKQILSETAELRLEAGKSVPLDLSNVDCETREGPYRLSVQTRFSEQDQGAKHDQVIFVNNAHASLLDFDHQFFLNGGKQTEEAKKEGRYGLEIAHGAGGIRAAVTDFRKILHGFPSQLSMWVKGNGSNAVLTFSGHDRGPNLTPFSTTPVLVDWEGWRRVTVSLPLGAYPTDTAPTRATIDYPMAINQIALSGRAEAAGKICIDEMSVLTGLPSSELAEVHLDLRLPSRIAAVGEAQQVVVENRSRTRPLKGTLRFEVVDSRLAGRDPKPTVLRSQDLKIALGPTERKTLPLGTRFEKAGPLNMRWTLVSDRGTEILRKDEECLVMRIEPDQADQLMPILCDEYQLYKLGSVKSDTLALEWNRIEPMPGDLNYDGYDSLLSKFRAVCPLGIGRLGYTTYWNSPRGNLFEQYGFWEGDAHQYPIDLKPWYNYVYETARRYKGQMDSWEVWHEPAKAQDDIDMSLPKYLRLLQIAAVAIRQANPQAKVTMGSLTPGGMKGYLDEFLKRGGGKWIDIVALHPVEGILSPEIQFLSERVRNTVATIRKHDPRLEAWVTSLVWPAAPDDTPGTLSEAMQAEYMARAKVLCLAAGVKRVIDHRIGINIDRQSASTVYKVRPRRLIPAASGVPPLPHWFLKPSFLTIKTVNEVLASAKYRQEVFLPDRSPHYSRCHLFETGPAEVLAVMWRRRGTSLLDLSGIASPSRGLDAYGNELDLRKPEIQLSPSPCYLFFPSSDLERLVGRLPSAKIAYEDHPDSRWKQRLLASVDRSPACLKAHQYVVKGEQKEYTATGEYRPSIAIRTKAAKITGSESFVVDLEPLKSDDLVIVRRVDLSQASQKVAVKIDGNEVARYDLTRADRFLKHSSKRILDVPLLIPNATIKRKGRVRIEFVGTDGAPFTSLLTRFYAKAPGPLYLSDIDYVAAQQSQSVLRPDENVVGRAIRMQNRVVGKGLGTHAVSQIVYYLGGQFRKLHVEPGLDQTIEDGSVTFQIIADSDTLHESKDTVTPYSKTAPIEIDVSGRQVLELRVGHGDDGIDGDWACWGEARVH